MSAIAVGPVGVVVDEPIEEFEQLAHLGWQLAVARMREAAAEEQEGAVSKDELITYRLQFVVEMRMDANSEKAAKRLGTADLIEGLRFANLLDDVDIMSVSARALHPARRPSDD